MYEASGRLPQALQDKPFLPWYLHDYLRAFLDLNRRREFFTAQQPIQLSEMEVYCREFGFDEDKDFFYKMMFDCDAEYMAHLAEKIAQEKELEKSKRPGKGYGRQR